MTKRLLVSKRLRASFLATAVILLAPIALAQTPSPPPEPPNPVAPCPRAGPTLEVVGCLKEHFGETPAYGGLTAPRGHLLQIFVHRETGNWTMVETTPVGTSVVRGFGTDWGSYAPPATATNFTPIHEWYGELRTPDGRMSCCNDRDCGPVPHRESPGGLGLEINIGGEWRPVPPQTIIRDRWSPDGQVHACCSGGECTRKGALIRCVVILGQGV